MDAPSRSARTAGLAEERDGSGAAPRIRRFPVGPFQANCYVVGPTAAGRLVVLDPGDEGPRIAELLREIGGDLAAILLTHEHLDHVGGVAHLKREFGAPVYLHAAGRELYDLAEAQARQFGLRLEQPPAPDRELSGGVPVEVDDLELEVRHTPGHSPGSVTLVAGSVAFVGDCVFAGSIGRTDLPGGDTDTLIDAIVSEILSLPADTLLLPGHGPETTVEAEAASNPFLAHLMEPCLHCGTPLPLRLYGCKGGHCPNCGHPYPHGDCSDA